MIFSLKTQKKNLKKQIFLNDIIFSKKKAFIQKIFLNTF